MPEADKMKTSPVKLGPRDTYIWCQVGAGVTFCRVIKRRLLAESRMVVHYSRPALPLRLVAPRGCRREQSVA